MISANEFRIGNLVRRKDNLQNDKGTDPVMVTNIHEQGINKGEAFEHFMDNIEPIPLTEEWLLKFGFQKLKTINFGEFIWRINSFELKQFSPNKWTHIVSYPGGHGYSSQGGRTTEYVHQLQNLYFALTGEELKEMNQTNYMTHGMVI